MGRCSFPRCECMHGKEDCGFAKMDPLVDRSCLILDGHCDCRWPKKDCKYVNQYMASNSKEIGHDEAEGAEG